MARILDLFVHWAHGGETSLENTLLLCPVHDTAVHEGGFTIEKDYRDRWFFGRPDGRAVPACGYRPEDMTDDTFETESEYFDGFASAETSRNSTETRSTSAEASMVREPPRPLYRIRDGAGLSMETVARGPTAA